MNDIVLFYTKRLLPIVVTVTMASIPSIMIFYYTLEKKYLCSSRANLFYLFLHASFHL
jgi:hypothetical protein